MLAFVVMVWRVPWWLDQHYLKDTLTPAEATVVSGLRTALVALGAGILAVIGLYYTHHTLQQTRARDREQAELAREEQVTDRFSKSVSQIASDRPVEQLGGIYALERIMRDSAKDHTTIVEVLAAFVREHAPLYPVPQTDEPPAFIRDRKILHLPRPRLPRFLISRIPLPVRMHLERFIAWNHPTQFSAPSRAARPIPRSGTTEAVQAALTVLGRRPSDRVEPFRLNLESTDLQDVNLYRANLQSAHLIEADLRGANLRRADLRGAHLNGAQLWGAHLYGADLRGADLSGAALWDADLGNANLKGAHLTVPQLLHAWLSRGTRLSSELAADSRIKDRIAEAEAAIDERASQAESG